MNSIISFKNITKKYEKLKVLDNLNFMVNEFDFVALVGNNGCGKTTTINVMCNLINYDSGEVTYKAKKITSNYVSYKNEIGMVLSKPYFIEEFDVRQYWRFVSKFQLVKTEEIEIRINDLIGVLGLENDLDKPIGHFSEGNKMKVTFGASLIHNPSLIILDEPFIHIDIGTLEKVVAMLKSFRNKKTLFISSHNLDLVLELCDVFMIMDKGRIVANFSKNDYPDHNTLKFELKNILLKENTNIDISWLR